MIMGTLSEYINQDSQTATTVAAQQYYYYPVGTVGVDSATITIGNVIYTLTPIYSQQSWNQINAMPFQQTTIPQFIFPRKSDFGIWPIPQDAYTITFQRFFRDRNLLVDDYTSGTVTVTAGSATVTGSSTTFTPAMVGRWFTVTDTTVPGQGYWYKVLTYSSATEIVLETFWNGSTSAGAAYRIGESPEMPEEGHIMLPSGTAADFYSGLRNDPERATWFNNVFWTGDGNNNNHDLSSKNAAGGLIGMLNKYKDRERDNIVTRQPGLMNPRYKVWGYSIS